MTTQAFPSADFIAGHYPPEQLVMASPGRRLGAVGLIVLIFVVAGFVASLIFPPLIAVAYVVYLVWFVIAANNGQTPGHQLLGMYIIKEDGTRAGGGGAWLRELVFKGLILSILSIITLGIFWIVAALWCTWDKDKQCLWDKMGSTYVAWSPSGFKPATANEIRMGASAPVPAPGSGLAASGSSVADQLRELARLRDESLITGDEYESRRERLVKEL